MLAARVADGFALKTSALVGFFGEEEAERACGNQGLRKERVKSSGGKCWNEAIYHLSGSKCRRCQGGLPKAWLYCLWRNSVII